MRHHADVIAQQVKAVCLHDDLKWQGRSLWLVKTAYMTTLQQLLPKYWGHMTPLDIPSQSGNIADIDKAYPDKAFIA